MAETDVVEVTEKELSEYLGLSDRRVRQLATQGVVIKSRRGRYDLKASVQGYINQLKQGGGEGLEKIKVAKEAEQLKHEQAKRRLTELKVQKAERKLHAQEDVEYLWNSAAVSVKSRLTAIPTKIAPSLVGIEDRKEIQAILKREVDDALNELANYDIDQFDKDFEDEDDDE